jgi:hypothetical protein
MHAPGHARTHAGTGMCLHICSVPHHTRVEPHHQVASHQHGCSMYTAHLPPYLLHASVKSYTCTRKMVHDPILQVHVRPPARPFCKHIANLVNRSCEGLRRPFALHPLPTTELQNHRNQPLARRPPSATSGFNSSQLSTGQVKKKKKINLI